MNFDNEMKLNFDVLDMIDIYPFIEVWADPDDIMDNIEVAYDNHEFSKEVEEIVQGDILQGFIFNLISTEDFIDYLHDRYGTIFNSEVKYWVASRGTDANI